MKKLINLIKRIFKSRVKENNLSRSLVVFDVPYNRFDEVFKNCGFAKEAQPANTLCEGAVSL